MQADEYFASALIVWFGGMTNPSEYKVSGNSLAGTGRQALHDADPFAFCLLSRLFKADSTWSPCEDLDFPNRAVKYDKAWCDDLIASRAMQCPSANVHWPNLTAHSLLNFTSKSEKCTTDICLEEKYVGDIVFVGFPVALGLLILATMLYFWYKHKQLAYLRLEDHRQTVSGEKYGAASDDHDFDRFPNE